jgi:hypothetical protein
MYLTHGATKYPVTFNWKIDKDASVNILNQDLNTVMSAEELDALRAEMEVRD